MHAGRVHGARGPQPVPAGPHRRDRLPQEHARQNAQVRRRSVVVVLLLLLSVSIFIITIIISIIIIIEIVVLIRSFGRNIRL